MQEEDELQLSKCRYALKKINIKMKNFSIYLFIFINIITIINIIYRNPNNTENLSIEIIKGTKPKLINFKEYNLTLSNNENILKLFENKYFSISNISYSSSKKYDIAKVEYNIGIYDEDQKLIYPSDLSLYNNLNVFCFCEISNDTKIFSLPDIDQNSYYKCVEFFKFDEKPNFGIKIALRERKEVKFYKLFVYSKDISNSSDLYVKNDTEFDPDYINKVYKSLVDKNKNKDLNKTLRFKEYYMKPPICKLRRTISNKSKWLFNNIYNYYFCFCVGINCLSLNIPQKRKYYKYMDIIENNRNLYPKTEYIFVDFIFKHLSSDDTYPIFEEMEEKNYPVHYITEHQDIYEKYCKDKPICSKIIKLGNDYHNYANFFEKHLTLILKLKAVVSCKESFFHYIPYLFFRLEYTTYIAATHGVCYFKDYLFKKNRIYGNMRNNKIIIPPSSILIEQAKKYGWKDEDIIKMNLPRWDKYNEEDQLKYKDEFKIDNNSILVMFTWRYNRRRFNLGISPIYYENIFKILDSDLLHDALEKKNITLYFSFHRFINKRYRTKYKNIINKKKNKIP